MYWNESQECMPAPALRALQTQRLVRTVNYVYQNVPYYRGRMQQAGLVPGDVRTLEDLAKLPFTYKQDLRDNYPYGMFARPLSEIVRIHASSGTTGKPIVVGYTQRDLENWAELIARVLVSAGADKHAVIQNAYGYGLFTGGLGVHYGAERIGATIIPISGGNTQRQIMLMKDFGTTMLTCTPSYALYLAETMREMGIDPNRDLQLRYGVFGAEPWTDSMRTEIERALGIRATDIYGLSEIVGPGVAYECEAQQGLHVSADHFIPEIIDPVTGDVLPEGAEGELVFTTITKEGIPMIRYRTRDLSSLNYEPCSCGRTHVRMHRILGRSDDMLIIRGVNVFPSQVETVLLRFAEVAPHYQLVVEREHNLDRLEVWVEMDERFFSDEVRRIEEVRARITADLESTLGISVYLKLVEPKTIARSEGKAKRVIDNRKM